MSPCCLSCRACEKSITEAPVVKNRAGLSREIVM